ncbi:hypothetical protein HRI_003121500 [Hibiscus trionum]|uniref:FAF domain-containing protein n=1 Tax=Hibiscus trionum TaxID=183268 RepID=A0A9W7IG40_HIBTR|nr:hypothetical protein HRI_003121500 [Hibiscus trionum]
MNSRGYFRLSKCGLGLIFNDETPRVMNPNVIESSSLVIVNDDNLVVPPPPPPPLPLPGMIGFIPRAERSGFERFEGSRVNGDISEGHHHHYHCEKERGRWRSKNTRDEIERCKKRFPPPLPWLNEKGQPCFYLKAVRKNGRLELTEVKIQRPESLRAMRVDGRLKLYFLSGHGIPSKISEEKGQDIVEESWKNRVTEEGLKRCQEVAMKHHHQDHHHQGWRQPCVITR